VVSGLQQLSQYLHMSYPFTLAILTQPFAIGAAIWLTVIVCRRRHKAWTAEFGPAELKQRIVDLQLRCAERGREITRLTARNAAIIASVRATSVAQAHAMQALGGVPELYEEETS
jgi:hypothetical protein